MIYEPQFIDMRHSMIIKSPMLYLQLYRLFKHEQSPLNNKPQKIPNELIQWINDHNIYINFNSTPDDDYICAFDSEKDAIEFKMLFM